MARIVEENIKVEKYLCEEKGCDLEVVCENGGKDPHYCCWGRPELTIKYCNSHVEKHCKHNFIEKDSLKSKAGFEAGFYVFLYNEVVFERSKRCDKCYKEEIILQKIIKVKDITKFFEEYREG